MLDEEPIPVRILVGDCRELLRDLPAESVHCCVTSPPYFQLRDYGCERQIGLEPTPDEFVAELIGVFREVWRVLRNDGTLWLNLGDSYNAYNAYNANRGSSNSISANAEVACPKIATGSGLTVKNVRPKSLLGIPWRVAFALQEQGWILRSEIIWNKPSCMPESVRDRPTKSHEHIFLLAKQERYYYNADAIREKWADHRCGNPGTASSKYEGVGAAGSSRYLHDTAPKVSGRNCRDVWTLGPEPTTEEHYAAFPSEIPRRAILAGSPEGGTVLDPFGGTGTTAAVAVRHGRQAILCELNPQYAEIARRRCDRQAGLFLPQVVEVVAPAKAEQPGLFAELGGAA